MKALLLAGGKGTRLWPLSRKNTPKQVLSPLRGDKSLLEMTFDRVKNLGFDSKDIYLVTNSDQICFISKIWDKLDGNSLIDEPCAKNTGPAVFLGLKYLLSKGLRKEESVFVFPTDHYIATPTLDLTLNLEDKIVCYGIKPTRAETAYGYIQSSAHNLMRKVVSFEEKPNKERAEYFFQSWSQNDSQLRYFWNSGIYAFSVSSLEYVLKMRDCEFYDAWDRMEVQEFRENYCKFPSMSFDKMIAEKADNLYVETLIASYWRDIGSWESVYDAVSEGSQDNVHVGLGQQIITESTGCLTYSDKNVTIACAGIDDLVVVVSGDTILVSKRGALKARTRLFENIQKEHKDLL